MSAHCHKVGLRVQQYRAQIGGLHQVDEDKTYGTLFRLWLGRVVRRKPTLSDHAGFVGIGSD